MRLTEKHFNSILRELIDENPIASRGILRVSKVEFTKEVPTLGITLGGKPKLCVNLDFINQHCGTESHVKAVIIHEFLHVLLNHTERFKRMTPALNLALDAVINAIIHRSLGDAYSDMMSEYYAKSKGPLRLLRPMVEGVDDKTVEDRGQNRFISLWRSLYEGKLVVDDLFDIARDIGDVDEYCYELGDGTFLGNHSETPLSGEEVTLEVEAALRETLSSMNGGGIWRNPRDHGVGMNYAKTDTVKVDSPIKIWEREATKVLLECVTPDKDSAFEHRPVPMSLPVLNEGDKRGFLRATWSPFLPDITWQTQKRVRRGTTQIYLDVSGSMNAEMDALVTLIWRLRRYIRLPFWAFSDTVQPAEIRDGRLVTSTTGGTSMDAVLQHIAETRPGKAVVITDGYIEEGDRDLLLAVGGQSVMAIVSRNGSPAALQRAGIPYSQLGRIAYDQNG